MTLMEYILLLFFFLYHNKDFSHFAFSFFIYSLLLLRFLWEPTTLNYISTSSQGKTSGSIKKQPIEDNDNNSSFTSKVVIVTSKLHVLPTAVLKEEEPQTSQIMSM